MKNRNMFSSSLLRVPYSPFTDVSDIPSPSIARMRERGTKYKIRYKIFYLVLSIYNIRCRPYAGKKILSYERVLRQVLSQTNASKDEHFPLLLYPNTF